MTIALKVERRVQAPISSQAEIDQFTEWLAGLDPVGPVEVGAMQRVPLARYVRRDNSKPVALYRLSDYGSALRGCWVPLVGGPPHDDAEIVGFPPLHVHADTRFLPEWRHDRPQAETLAVPFLLTTDTRMLHGAFRLQWCIGRRRCRRLTPEWPVAPWRRDLVEAHRGCRLDAEGRCPHRGLPVAGGATDAHGRRQCPGHGLIFNPDGTLHDATSLRRNGPATLREAPRP